MFLNFAVGIFTVANSFIAMFILIYAVLFMKKTKNHQDRRPWDYLLIASVVYLLYSVLIMLVQIYNIEFLYNLNVYQLTIFFQFLYTGLILLSFISQTDLIFKNDVIIIMRKLDSNEKESFEAKDFSFLKQEQKAAEKQLQKISGARDEVETELKETQKVEKELKKRSKK